MHSTTASTMAITTAAIEEPSSIRSYGYGPDETATGVHEPIIDGPVADGPAPNIEFDPEIHLAFDGKIESFTWEQLGYPIDHGISPVAVCQPFQLFTNEAINIMRAEILRKEVLEKYRVSSTIAAMQVRGYVEECAPFIYTAWKHPKTLEILSQVAGIDVAIRMDHEIGHVNFSVKPETKAVKANAEAATGHYKKEREVVGWHRDSYPFSTVTMLSDCTNIEGGETVLQLGNGKMHKLRRAQMGQCVVLQGRYVLHKGLTASAGKERMSMVTSLWPASPMARDESFLTNIRTVSNNDELYVQFAAYQLELLEERFHAQSQEIKKKRGSEKKLDTSALKKFITTQIEHLHGMAAALLEYGEIERGIVYESLQTEPIVAT